MSGFDQPTFEYRQITIGPEMGDNYLVLKGLRIGDEVVTRGSFTIDAAAQLSGKTSMMNPSKTDEMAMPVNDGTETSFLVEGNCDFCKKRIEGALQGVPGIFFAGWNLDTKMMSVQYDEEKITEESIHEKISSVGHDTDKMKAPDDVYDELMECCKYERKK
ncbi:MAG: cation transporter [Flavobacteriales bacterium]|nr:cation transporter [Flavobacteriales bacterium]